MEEEKNIVVQFEKDVEEVIDELSPEMKEKVEEAKQKISELYNKIDEVAKTLNSIVSTDERNVLLMRRPIIALLWRTESFMRATLKLKRKLHQGKITPEKYVNKLIKKYIDYVETTYLSFRGVLPKFGISVDSVEKRTPNPNSNISRPFFSLFVFRSRSGRMTFPAPIFIAGLSGGTETPFVPTAPFRLKSLQIVPAAGTSTSPTRTWESLWGHG